MLNIRIMEQGDLVKAAYIHKVAFVRQMMSLAWLECNLNAHPRSFCFVAAQEEQEGVLLGYIIWSQKSGFRSEVVLELEQLAVLPDHHGQGIGQTLIKASLPLVKERLADQGSVLKHIVVTTRADNSAQKLYRKTLGADVEATLSNLYSSDEVVMVARRV